MNKKILGIITIVLAVGMFFMSSQIAKSQYPPSEVDVLVSPHGLDMNGDPEDGRIELSLIIASAPTIAYSGVPERIYLKHISVDISKPTKIDDAIAESIWADELQYNRNVTHMYWVDGRRIFRTGN